MTTVYIISTSDHFYYIQAKSNADTCFCIGGRPISSSMSQKTLEKKRKAKERYAQRKMRVSPNLSFKLIKLAEHALQAKFNQR